MSVQFRVDDSEFQATLKEYLRVSTRTLPQALNEKMFYIARGASRNTPKVDRAKVEQELNVIGYKIRKGKKGKIRSKSNVRGAAIIGAPLIYKIINARRTFAGKPGLNNKDMRTRVRKVLSARFRSVGTLKAGWWNALNILGKAVGQTLLTKKEHNMRVSNPSQAQIAKDGWNPKVSLEYNLNSKDPAYRKGIDQRIKSALEAAFSDEMRSMKKYIEDKLSGALKKADKSVSGKTTDLAAYMRSKL